MTWTILHDACEHEDAETVIKLSKERSDEAISLDDHGATPLHIACFNNPPLEVVKALVEAHPEALLLKDMHGDTPLHIALSNPATSLDIVQALVDACPQVLKMANREGLMPLHKACRFNYMNDEIISFLLEAYGNAANVRIRLGDLMRSKCRSEAAHTQHPVVEGSPRRGCFNINNIDLRFDAIGEQERDGSYPLHMAVSNRASIHVLDMLINAGPHVVFCTNKYNETPLHLALSSHPPDDATVEILLQADEENQAVQIAEHRRCGDLPIHLAVRNGSLSDVVQLLTRFPHAVRIPNKDGDLPIDLAKGNEELMDILMVSDEADLILENENDSRSVESIASDEPQEDLVDIESAVSFDSSFA